MDPKIPYAILKARVSQRQEIQNYLIMKHHMSLFIQIKLKKHSLL